MSDMEQLISVIKSGKMSHEKLLELQAMANAQLSHYDQALSVISKNGEAFTFEDYKEALRLGSGGNEGNMSRSDWDQISLFPEKRLNLRNQLVDTIKQGQESFAKIKIEIEGQLSLTKPTTADTKPVETSQPLERKPVPRPVIEAAHATTPTSLSERGRVQRIIGRTLGGLGLLLGILFIIIQLTSPGAANNVTGFIGVMFLCPLPLIIVGIAFMAIGRRPKTSDDAPTQGKVATSEVETVYSFANVSPQNDTAKSIQHNVDLLRYLAEHKYLDKDHLAAYLEMGDRFGMEIPHRAELLEASTKMTRDQSTQARLALANVHVEELTECLKKLQSEPPTIETVKMIEFVIKNSDALKKELI